jgi:hypothetical protein
MDKNYIFQLLKYALKEKESYGISGTPDFIIISGLNNCNNKSIGEIIEGE